MTGLNFNQFFGYEDLINKNEDLVLIYGFAFLIFGMMALAFISLICSKLGLNAIVNHFIAPMLIAFALSMIVAILPTIIFKTVANDLSGVKLIYIWIIIFSGMTFFSFLNYPMIKKRMSR